MGISACYDNDRVSLKEKQKELKRRKGKTATMPEITIKASQLDYESRQWASSILYLPKASSLQRAISIKMPGPNNVKMRKRQSTST
jgi:hypothetical protein